MTVQLSHTWRHPFSRCVWHPNTSLDTSLLEVGRFGIAMVTHSAKGIFALYFDNRRNKTAEAWENSRISLRAELDKSWSGALEVKVKLLSKLETIIHVLLYFADYSQLQPCFVEVKTSTPASFSLPLSIYSLSEMLLMVSSNLEIRFSNTTYNLKSQIPRTIMLLFSAFNEICISI